MVYNQTPRSLEIVQTEVKTKEKLFKKKYIHDIK